MSANQKKPIAKLNVVISIVIAFVAWLFVVYNYSPMKSVTYSNVPINYVGELELTQNGLGIESSTADTVDVTLSVNRLHFNQVSAEDIIVNADVSNAIEGTNGISLEVIAPENCTFEKIGTKTVSVEVVSGASKDVDVTTIYDNASDNTVEPYPTNMSYYRVSVLGAADNVNKVCGAVIKISTASLADGTKSFVSTPIAVDENGKKVSHVVVLPSEISYDATEGIVKTVDLVLNVRDADHGNGKSVEYPDKVTIKGPAKAIGKITSIDAADIDVTGITENTKINIALNLPKGVYVAQKSLGLSAKVVVK